MRTLGIDLSASEGKTAACETLWPKSGEAVEVVSLQVGKLSDSALIELILNADHAAIDAPFGSPDEFITAVRNYADTGHFPTTERKRLRFRETDRMVETTARLPLSVASDRIAVTAMRCASILTLLKEQGQRVDRAGGANVLEVYPAAALVRWGIDASGYKTGDNAKTARARILNALVDKAEGWLRLAPETRALCIRNDDALDGLVCALIARAAALGLTAHAPPNLQRTAQREGWIHLPRTDSLAKLSRGK